MLLLPLGQGSSRHSSELGAAAEALSMDLGSCLACGTGHWGRVGLSSGGSSVPDPSLEATSSRPPRWQHPPRDQGVAQPLLLLPTQRRCEGKRLKDLCQGYKLLIFGRASPPLELAPAASC